MTTSTHGSIAFFAINQFNVMGRLTQSIPNYIISTCGLNWLPEVTVYVYVFGGEINMTPCFHSSESWNLISFHLGFSEGSHQHHSEGWGWGLSILLSTVGHCLCTLMWDISHIWVYSVYLWTIWEVCSMQTGLLYLRVRPMHIHKVITILTGCFTRLMIPWHSHPNLFMCLCKHLLWKNIWLVPEERS